MTIPGELARVTGPPRPDAGRGNRALVAEGYATMPASGVYQATQERQNPSADKARRAALVKTQPQPDITEVRTASVGRLVV
jgi:hypothetical protein